MFDGADLSIRPVLRFGGTHPQYRWLDFGHVEIVPQPQGGSGTMLFAKLLKRIIRKGALRLTDADGHVHRFGGVEPGPVSAIRLHDRRLHSRLALNPRLYIGEAYMDGTLTIEEGTLRDFFDLVGVNAEAFEGSPWQAFFDRMVQLGRPLQQFNPLPRSRRNVAHHYDLSDRLYELFLDKDQQYSCAYFRSDNESLEVAQENKKRHIAAKLLLEPGQRVLDIGCGWGGMALHLAKEADCDVTGITLSERQHAVATRRAEEAGLSHRVRFHLRDYREETERYDRIVSVGMFEHVGALHHRQFFAKVKELLADDGVALLHSIGRMEPPGSTNAWIRKYIFPGGYSPALSETLAAVERTGLWVTDMEILRLHYAKTLAEWKRRFDQNREEILRLYDERFVRMWEFYLLACESSFLYWRQMVFQLQLSKKLNAVPLTRDYMVDRERERMAA
ncbi:cyclopropane-fatty-acyl-phospholipid synthase [Constrictibacter sp. MBR-5]|jgi:cyclopropane-fatty-acyl-phospholipid synthase